MREASTPTDQPADFAASFVRMAEDAAANLVRARAEIGKAIFGQERVIEEALVTVLSGGHALLVGVPGLAKTKLVETMGKVLGLDAGVSSLRRT